MIDELAKKVFHALKTGRENFKFEFSDTRRRTSRRPQFAAKGPSHGASPKFATNTRSSNTSVNLLSKSTTSPLNGSSNLRRTGRGNPGSLGGTNPLRARDHETPFGKKINPFLVFFFLVNGNLHLSSCGIVVLKQLLEVVEKLVYLKQIDAVHTSQGYLYLKKMTQLFQLTIEF